MKLPYSNNLPIDRLSQCFNDTTNSYKFYWFLAILEEVCQNQRTILKMSDLALRMVSLVWYPLDYYKLSFGKPWTKLLHSGFVMVSMEAVVNRHSDNKFWLY